MGRYHRLLVSVLGLEWVTGWQFIWEWEERFPCQPDGYLIYQESQWKETCSIAMCHTINTMTCFKDYTPYDHYARTTYFIGYKQEQMEKVFRHKKVQNILTAEPIRISNPCKGYWMVLFLMSGPFVLGKQVGSTILYFGCRNKATDFIYEEELTDYVKKGTLTKLYTAFSRDQPQKVYVQHLLQQNADETWKVLENNGHIYICGWVALWIKIFECLLKCTSLKVIALKNVIIFLTYSVWTVVWRVWTV